MNEFNSCADLNTISLNEQTNFGLNKINKIKDYFESEIKDRELVNKKLSKYITGFDYTDKMLIAFSTIFSGASISSHLNFIEKHTGLITSTFVLIFSLSTAIIKKLLYETKKRKKNIIKYFIWVKIN